MFPLAHLPRVLLQASEEVTYNGVVSMRKESFLSLDIVQWELKKCTRNHGPGLCQGVQGVVLREEKAQFI